MPNLINMFWGLFAVLFGFLSTIMIAPLANILVGMVMLNNTFLGWALQIAVVFWAIVWLFVVPAITVMSDDNDPLFKKIVYAAQGKPMRR